MFFPSPLKFSFWRYRLLRKVLLLTYVLGVSYCGCVLVPRSRCSNILWKSVHKDLQFFLLLGDSAELFSTHQKSLAAVKKTILDIRFSVPAHFLWLSYFRVCTLSKIWLLYDIKWNFHAKNETKERMNERTNKRMNEQMK